MNYVLLGISLCLGVSKNLISKAAKKEFNGLNRLMSANLVTAALALVVFSVSGLDFSRMADPVFIVLALLYGLFTMGSQSLYILAVKNGSVSVCSLIYASCFLIPTVFSACMYENGMAFTKLIGIGVMLVSVLLVSFQKREENKKFDLFSLIAAILAMLAAGSVGILQKLYSHDFGGEGMNEYLFLSFAFMLFFSLGVKGGMFFAGKRQSNASTEVRPYRPIFFLFAAMLAVSVVVANKMNMYLVGVLPGVLFFPIINGGTVMASALLSRVLFGEKLTPMRISGLLIGLVAMVLIAL